ncbi:MAG: hypothetical protein LLG06_04740, partial [Desulfobacteraceae bacterium]|nr:hypothetical protein [Desulfobacteraceae bacterium]
MDEIGLQTFVELVKNHWVSAFFILLTLATICVILVLRWYVRKRLQALLQNRFEEEHELDLLDLPGAREQQCLELIARL